MTIGGRHTRWWASPRTRAHRTCGTTSSRATSCRRRKPPSAVKSPTFLIRTAARSAPVLAAVRKTIQRVDAALPIVSARSIEEQMAPLTAQDRTTAQLAVVFGCVALTLAAIGLYGVLSYGIARRTRRNRDPHRPGSPARPRDRDDPPRDHRARHRRAGAGRGPGLRGFAPDRQPALRRRSRRIRSRWRWRSGCCCWWRSARRTCRRGGRRDWIRWRRCGRSEGRNAPLKGVMAALKGRSTGGRASSGDSTRHARVRALRGQDPAFNRLTGGPGLLPVPGGVS